MSLEAVARFATASIGPCEVVAEHSWPHGESVVVELLAADGRRVIGKLHRQPVKFVDELHAYRMWVPSLGDRAPQLIDLDDRLRILLISRLPAEPISTERARSDPSVHRQAGALLRRFHESQLSVELVDHAAERQRSVETWLARARPGLLDDAERAFARAQIDVLRRYDDPVGVPCHRDWQARNWLVDSQSRLYAIDFEHARVRPWTDDLHRLWWEEWHGRPQLADAFFEGYGRRPNSGELDAMIAASLIGHVSTIVWADEHRDQAFGEFGRRCLHAAMGD